MSSGKIPKTNSNLVSTNGCATEGMEDSKPIDVSAHFPSYSTNFSNSTNCPPVYPPANISVPPPSVNALNHVTTIHNLGTPSSVRQIQPNTSTPTQQPFPPYGYPSNSSFFSGGTPTGPSSNQRSYYPPPS